MSAPLDRDALLAFLRERAAAARVDHTPGLLVTAVLGGLVSRIEAGQFDLQVREGVCLTCGDGVLDSGEHIDPERHAAALASLKPGTTYYIKAAGHHDRTPIVTDSIFTAFALTPQCSCQSSFDGEGDGHCAVHRDDGCCDWDVDDGGRDDGIARLPHDFSGDDDCCVNCYAPKPAATKPDVATTFVEETLPKASSSTCEVGTCDLCGQEMLRTPKDCWHPWTVKEACPPTRQNANGLNVPEWGSPGRPGREHFREAKQ